MPEQVNRRIAGMNCIRCDARFCISDYFEGCPRCRSQGFPASLAFHYAELPRTLRNLGQWQVYPEHITLGEGWTPLVDVPTQTLDVDVAHLSIKDEGANPTGSHKDRMSRFIVQRACEIGADTVSAASSGNAGVSLAAYAHRAGLKCVVVTTRDINAHWRDAIASHEAQLVFAENVQQRWSILAQCVRAGEWYPATNFTTPAVGSNPYGVDGYRSIAFEIFLQKGPIPYTDIIVPTSRADLLWGLVRGFEDLKNAGFMPTLPRVHAVEPFSRITSVLAGADYRLEFDGVSTLTSIGGSTVTYQALAALTSTGGTVAIANQDQAYRDQKRLASVGLNFEVSSAAALSALRALRHSEAISANASVVLIGTARGFPLGETG